MGAIHKATNVFSLQTKAAYVHHHIEQDPVCDVLRDAIRHAREELGMTLEEISAKALVGWTTINNISVGKTRRPWNQTAQRILEACGYRRLVIKAMFDASGKELDPAKMHKALMKIVTTPKLSQAEMISIARIAIGLKK